MLRLYDTAIGEVAELEPRDSGRVSIYLCGPTVSGVPHIGHARTSVVWDVVRRYLRWRGLGVRFVSNVTDIEDKIIATANAEHSTAEEVAERYEGLWYRTMDRLGVERPDANPHATSYIDDMVALISRLVERGHAYPGGDGVYFSVESVADYGLLIHQPLGSLRAGARVEAGEEAGKRSPVDFALWKAAREGEPEWPSPWGAGRPGWHTECVVMSLDLLGEGFDLHVGGNDLIFPHHENERAQAVGDGRAFARRWAHSGMVEAKGGEKMSKSLGNTLSLPELLEGYDPRALRLLVLQSHYRRPMEVAEDNLTGAARGVARLDAFAREFAAARGTEPDGAVVARFVEGMERDLDTPAAVRYVFEAVSEARAAEGERAERLAAAVFELTQGPLGLPIGGEEAIPSDIAALVTARDDARKTRDFPTSDHIRDELTAAGWIVEDTPEGTKIHR